MKNYILSIDQGTTGTTALLIDAESLALTEKVNSEFPQIFPKPGWVEHDLNDIWATIKETCLAVIQKASISPDQIISIGITNQRETTCAFNKEGKPLHNAIVWQDRRTSQYCDNKRKSYEGLQKKTGLPLDPYFSGTKMNWLLNHSDKVKAAAQNKELRFGTIDTFLVHQLTAGESFVTEPSNASRTLLMDLDSCQWDQALLDFFEVPAHSLPTIKESFSLLGSTKDLDFLPDGIPISCILGDQQAALFGQAGYKQGDLKCTYGTGAFILLNTGAEKIYSSHGLLTTVAYKKDGKACYALEGSCYIAGAAVQWLRDQLNIIDDSPSVEALAEQVGSDEEMEHLLFLPFFTGIGSPHWKADAKGAIVGITRDTGNPHIARACLEGVALSVNDSIEALVADSPAEVKEIRVDGGACQNNFLMQKQANISQKNIIRPQVIETTAYGVALGSLVGLGNLEFESIGNLWKEDLIFLAQDDTYSAKKVNQWKQVIKQLY